MSKYVRFFLTPILIGLITIIFLLPNISEPFWNHHEFNGVFYGTMANNYLRYGLIATKGAQVTTPYPTEIGAWGLHTHHPATYPLLLAGWFDLFGSGEAQARSLSIVASMIALISLSLWLKKIIQDDLLILLSLGIMIVSPLFLYYGKLPVFEPLLFPLISLGLWRYHQGLPTKGKKSDRLEGFDVVFYSSIFLAFLLDWPGFWLGFWIWWFELIIFRRKKILVGIAVSMLAALGLILLHQKIVTGFWLQDFLDIGSNRFTTQPFTMVEWFKLLVSRTKAFLGLPVIILSGFGAMCSLYAKRNTLTLVSLSLTISLSHIFVFRNITWYHDYMLYHLLPFWALTLALGLQAIKTLFSTKIAVLIGLSSIVLTLIMTNQFRIDLQNMDPHKKCVEFGKKVATATETLTFVGTLEETNSCPPFIGFYGQKKFTTKVDTPIK